MRNVIKKINETGTLLVEALAMLGLISMVTPVLYKKASERTVELQDINASSQLRALSTAMDSYLKDKFAEISRGETVDGIDYGDFKDSESASKTIEADEIANVLGGYLPYGFLDNDGTLRETKLFRNYSIIIKSESELKDGKAVNQTLTSFIVIPPKNDEDFSEKRAARVASMVGSNGGYVTKEPDSDNFYAMGAQGIWKVPVNELGNPTRRTMVISSLQPISSQGLANEDVLHRHDEPDADDELNSMTTDLFLGYGNNQPHNIRMVNQIIMTPVAEGMVDKDTGRPANNASATSHGTDDKLGENYTTSLDNALYIGNKGGAYLEGVLKAMDDHFTVTADGIKYFGDTTTTDETTGEEVTNKNTDATFSVTASEMIYGNPGNGNAKLKVTSNGIFSFGKDGYTPEGGEPVAAKRLIYADDDMVNLGNGYLSVKNDDTKWNTVVGGGDAWNGAITRYVWNGDVPDDGTEEADQNYELTVNGSAYVRDTILTAKLKTFDVDAATLRAGVSHENFNDANDDDFFMKVKAVGSEAEGSYSDVFVVGHNDAPIMTVTTNSENEYDAPLGVVIHTTEDANYDTSYSNTYERIWGNAPGINIVAGNSALPLAYADRYYFYGMDGYNGSYSYDNDPDNGAVKIGGEKGVYISALDGNGDMTNFPVSIQGNTLRVFQNEQNDFGPTVWASVDHFNVFSSTTSDDALNGDCQDCWYHYYYMPSYTRAGSAGYAGRMLLGDSNLMMGTTERDSIFLDVSYIPTQADARKSAAMRLSGGFALYDWGKDLQTMDNVDNEYAKGSDGRDALLYANNGRFELRSSQNTYTDDDEVLDANAGKTGGKVRVLTVDTNDDGTNYSDADYTAKHGSVYIRRGSIVLESGLDADKNRSLTNAKIKDGYVNDNRARGYIAADRFISHYGMTEAEKSSVLDIGASGVSDAQDIGKNLKAYDGYEVNPAYTSVMHDIKLTTRGGARLSDILPDFINKGIYVVDSTYEHNEWDKSTGTPYPEEVTSGQEASEYLGFVPTPKCPPGYSKVITLTPATWAMAQAGTPVKVDDRIDIYTPTNPDEYLKDVGDGKEVSSYVLRFQKNTWLKSMVRPYCGDMGAGHFTNDPEHECNVENFQGWGAIMGFIYPSTLYNLSEFGLDPDAVQEDNVIWNLFPVKYKELEGYATVYCYFDRKEFTPSMVDVDYDQLFAARNGGANAYRKGDRQESPNGETYLKRLDDPNLKYYSPW